MRSSRLIITAATILGVAGLGASAALGAETKGPVTDDIGVVKYAKGEPIPLGLYTVLSGPDLALGVDQMRGVQIAIQDRGGMVAGHPVRLIQEDSQCTAEGGQTAATKLAANQKIAIVVGAACSSATVPGAPILWRAGIPSVGITPTAPVLTAADRPSDYDGFVRVIWNDLWAGQLTADYAQNVMGRKRAAAIHDGSPYAQGLAQVFADQFTANGGTVIGVEAVSPTDTDMHPVLTRIASGKPDIIFYPTFVAATAHITRQAREIDGLENTQLLGADGANVPEFKELAGKAALTFTFTGNDLSPATLGKGYPDFVKKYEAEYGEKPIAGFHHFGYDAGWVALAALEKVAVTDDAGNTYVGRKALRDALFATKGYDGLSGPKTCNEYGDCGTFNLAVYQYMSVDEPFELGKNPVKVWP